MFRTFVQGIAATLIYIAAWLLALAGIVFNWLVDHTVIQFAAFYSTIKDGVENAWTAFRDISNIIIIGMFTFTAISIILGVKEFGEKKLIAHVLIIAVLINFSLLFAKIVIDGSNFVATQLYQAAGFQPAKTSGIASNSTDPNVAALNPFGDGYAQAGIAGQFINLMGVRGFSDSYNSLDKISEATDNGWVTLLHGLFVTVILLGAAGVLFYGSFLLLSRAIILVFLMVTASLAFASYLVPGWGKSSYGFKAWRESLLWGSAFAPMLMFFLWATLSIAYEIHNAADKNGSLGKMLADPTNAANLNAFFIYIFVLGLLFVSLKLTNFFSKQVGGMDWANMLTAAPITLGARYLAAPFLKNTLGALGGRFESSQLDAAKGFRDKAGLARELAKQAKDDGHTFSAGRFQNLASTYESRMAKSLERSKYGAALASSTMNLMNTPAAKEALKAMGVKEFAKSQSDKDDTFAGGIKHRSDEAQKLAAKVAPSTESNADAKREARNVIEKQRKLGEQQLEATREAAKGVADAAKATEDLGNKLTAARDNARTTEESATSAKARHATDSTISENERRLRIRAEDQKIDNAKKAVTAIESRINFHDSRVKELDKEIDKYKENTDKLAKKAGDNVVSAINEVMADVAQHVGEKEGDILTRAIGSVTGANKEVGKKARGLYKKKARNAPLREALKELQDEEGTPARAPAAPPSEPAH